MADKQMCDARCQCGRRCFLRPTHKLWRKKHRCLRHGDF